MKTKTKIWLGVGAFAVVGAGAAATSGIAGPVASDVRTQTAPSPDAALRRAPAGAFVLAQHGDHPQPPRAEAGEGGQKGLTNLPPELAFATRIALLRGHLLIGDELVKQQQWSAALPHFLHPTEELYGDLKDKLEEYKIAPFDGALKALSDVVKARKAADYAKAKKTVDDALTAADAAMKERTGDWPGFTVETAVEALKAASGEYKDAIVDGKLAKPVEYQDARGFILQGERMIESVAAELEKKNPEALVAVRAGLAELKKAFPTAMPPRVPVKDHAAVLADVASIELAAAKLM
jgi:hypothetical protein